MSTTSPSPTTQLQTLRANAARDLETWRGLLAEFETRRNSRGVYAARTSIHRLGLLLFDIDGLLADVEAGR